MNTNSTRLGKAGISAAQKQKVLKMEQKAKAAVE